MRGTLRYILTIVFLDGGAWVLSDRNGGLSRAFEAAYGFSHGAAVKLTLFAAIVQMGLAAVGATEERLRWAKRLSMLFLVLGTTHILYLLIGNVKVVCGCALGPKDWSPATLNWLSLLKNAVLAALVIRAAPDPELETNPFDATVGAHPAHTL